MIRIIKYICIALLTMMVTFTPGHSSGESVSRYYAINDMIDSLFVVHDSSGILIHTEGSTGYIITAFHTVSEFYTFSFKTQQYEYNKGTFIPIVKVDRHKKNKNIGNDLFFGTGLDVDSLNDLVLIKVNLGGHSYKPAPVSIIEPMLGEDIYIVGNPDANYNSITKGIISNKDRELNAIPVWQISGGVVPGASGGGAFNIYGDLVGIVKAVEYYKATTNQKGVTCDVYIPFIGFFVPLGIIQQFILKSKIKESFNYLK